MGGAEGSVLGVSCEQLLSSELQRTTLFGVVAFSMPPRSGSATRPLAFFWPCELRLLDLLPDDLAVRQQYFLVTQASDVISG